ncbi:DUF6524 family protein [Oceanibium sediminis]|uniref:DUF6524 family protein n=1 Tax=Oceanibium sediminis TaxID=2026339 RepID=UPI000DD38E82|nr:DUF6524 family protein [Oceanibium sediminis]
MGRSFLIRWLVALLLVFVTFNPTSLNYVNWARNNWGESTPMIVLVGLILFIAYIVFFRATFRSIGVIGIGLVVALVGAVLWVFYSWGWIDLENPTALTWIGLLALSLIMGVGLSWSIIRRRLSGQLDVDDVEQGAE